MIHIASFWKRESKNNQTYYQGRMDSGRLLLFQNRDKKSENSPDLMLYVVENTSMKKDGQEEQQSQTEHESDLPF